MSPLPLAAAAALLGAVGRVAYLTAHPAAQGWGKGFRAVPEAGARVALTFDDGPSNETERVLELLDRHEARATFFLCGRNVERRPETARRTHAAGHEIGNHSFDHPPLLRLPRRAVLDQVRRTQEVIADRVGVTPKLFRPPYGIRSPFLPAALEANGLTSVHWTVIGMDWKWAGPRVAGRVLRHGSRPGAVICLHDGDAVRATADRQATLDALEVILPQLRERGFGFVTASDLASARQSP